MATALLIQPVAWHPVKGHGMQPDDTMSPDEVRRAKQREAQRRWRANPENKQKELARDRETKRKIREALGKDAVNEAARDRRNADIEAFRVKQRAYYAANRERRREVVREHGRKLRLRDRTNALAAYGGCCACCDEATQEFLGIDHVNGGGRHHRKTIGAHTYAWLRQQGYPEGFRVLCHNCNMAIGLYGSCPHSRNKPITTEGNV